MQSTGPSKGGVEGEVGRLRRRNLVPVPRVESIEELNELVAAGDARDDRRRIFGRPLSVGTHFEIEAPALRPLPAVPFDSSLLLRPRVDTKSRVMRAPVLLLRARALRRRA